MKVFHPLCGSVSSVFDHIFRAHHLAVRAVVTDKRIIKHRAGRAAMTFRMRNWAKKFLLSDMK